MIKDILDSDDNVSQSRQVQEVGNKVDNEFPLTRIRLDHSDLKRPPHSTKITSEGLDSDTLSIEFKGGSNCLRIGRNAVDIDAYSFHDGRTGNR